MALAVLPVGSRQPSIHLHTANMCPFIAAEDELVFLLSHNKQLTQPDKQLTQVRRIVSNNSTSNKVLSEGLMAKSMKTYMIA